MLSGVSGDHTPHARRRHFKRPGGGGWLGLRGSVRGTFVSPGRGYHWQHGSRGDSGAAEACRRGRRETDDATSRRDRALRWARRGTSSRRSSRASATGSPCRGRAASSSTRTTPPRGSAGSAPARSCSSLSATELLRRFEIVGEDGRPLPLEELPNRRALRDREPESGVVGYRIVASGEERWSELRVDADLHRRRPAAARDQRVPRHHRGAAGRESRALPRGGEHAPRRPRSTTRRRSADLAGLLVPEARRLLHRRRRRWTGTCARSSSPTATRSARSCSASCGAAIRRRQNEAHPVSEVLRSGEPYLVEDARGEALAHAAVDEEHLALYHALEAMSYIVVPLEARGRVLGTISLGTGESGRRFGAPSSSSRARSPAALRWRSTTPSSSRPHRSRSRSSTRCSSRRRSGSGSGTAIFATSASTTPSPR